MAGRTLIDAGKQAAKLLLVMAAGSALFVFLSLVISPTAPAASPSSPSPPLPTAPYAGDQTLIHVVTGFFAGAVSLDPAVALVGAVVGPAVDLDHLGYYAGLPVEARVDHSFLFVAMLVLLDSRFHFWQKGTRNFFIFISLEFSVHLAVAPPGFPLYAPLSETVVFFPRIYHAALAAVLAAGFLIDSLRLRNPGSTARPLSS